MTADKHTLAFGAGLGATGVEVFCVYDGLREASAAQMAAGVAIAILAPLVPAYIEGARRYFATIVFVFALVCVIVASGSRVGHSIDAATQERELAARAAKLAEDTERDTKTALADARASEKTACERPRSSACTAAKQRADGLLAKLDTARKSLTAAPVVSGEGDVARVAAWTGGWLTEQQVRLYLPLLWPVTMALVGAFFWGVWGDGRPKTVPTVTLAAPAAVEAPAEAPSVPATEHGSVRRFMLACIKRTAGEKVTRGAVYKRYMRWCDEQEPHARPLPIPAFWEQFEPLCTRVEIQLRQRAGKVWCVDIQLAA